MKILSHLHQHNHLPYTITSGETLLAAFCNPEECARYIAARMDRFHWDEVLTVRYNGDIVATINDNTDPGFDCVLGEIETGVYNLKP